MMKQQDRGRKIERSHSLQTANSAPGALGTVLIRYSKIWSPGWPNTLKRAQTVWAVLMVLPKHRFSYISGNIKRMPIKTQLFYKVFWDSVLGSTFWKYSSCSSTDYRHSLGWEGHFPQQQSSEHTAHTEPEHTTVKLLVMGLKDLLHPDWPRKLGKSCAPVVCPAEHPFDLPTIR